MTDQTIAVIGLGYVGLPTAALMARAGFDVHGVDINPDTVAALNEGRSGRLTASTEPGPADVFIICVPTPVTEDKKSDVSIVAAAMKAVAPHVKKGDLVILESTSPIGTTETVIGGALAAAGLDPRTDVDVCYCPERVFPGATVSEILDNDRIVGGLTEKAALRAKAMYERFCNGTPLVTKAAAAEFSKLMENTYRDVNIALANVFGHIAEEAGIDVAEVIALANRHPRVNVHTPGPGVGGHCIPVDPWFLVDGFPGVTDLLLQSRRINDGQAKHLWARAKAAGAGKGKVAILGAAYRGDLDDARDTPTEHLIEALEADGLDYVVHDPFVSRFKLHSGRQIPIETDLAAALTGADCAVVMTDHSAYRGLGADAFSGMAGRVVVDGRGLLDAARLRGDGLTVIPVGAPAA
jgi:UDP-N-acetyl-D-mannosaminuronic acid dehydrogenase